MSIIPGHKKYIRYLKLPDGSGYQEVSFKTYTDSVFMPNGKTLDDNITENSNAHIDLQEKIDDITNKLGDQIQIRIVGKTCYIEILNKK